MRVNSNPLKIKKQQILQSIDEHLARFGIIEERDYQTQSYIKLAFSNTLKIINNIQKTEHKSIESYLAESVTERSNEQMNEEKNCSEVSQAKGQQQQLEGSLSFKLLEINSSIGLNGYLNCRGQCEQEKSQTSQNKSIIRQHKPEQCVFFQPFVAILLVVIILCLYFI